MMLAMLGFIVLILLALYLLVAGFFLIGVSSYGFGGLFEFVAGLITLVLSGVMFIIAYNNAPFALVWR